MLQCKQKGDGSNLFSDQIPTVSNLDIGKDIKKENKKMQWREGFSLPPPTQILFPYNSIQTLHDFSWLVVNWKTQCEYCKEKNRWHLKKNKKPLWSPSEEEIKFAYLDKGQRRNQTHKNGGLF